MFSMEPRTTFTNLADLGIKAYKAMEEARWISLPSQAEALKSLETGTDEERKKEAIRLDATIVEGYLRGATLKALTSLLALVAQGKKIEDAYLAKVKEKLRHEQFKIFLSMVENYIAENNNAPAALPPTASDSETKESSPAVSAAPSETKTESKQAPTAEATMPAAPIDEKALQVESLSDSAKELTVVRKQLNTVIINYHAQTEEFTIIQTKLTNTEDKLTSVVKELADSQAEVILLNQQLTEAKQSLEKKKLEVEMLIQTNEVRDQNLKTMQQKVFGQSLKASKLTDATPEAETPTPVAESYAAVVSSSMFKRPVPPRCPPPPKRGDVKALTLTRPHIK